MGQYYKVYMQRENGEEDVFDTNVSGVDDFFGAKIMEHSWWKNLFCNCVAKLIYKNPAKIAWVGDYADDTNAENINEIYNKVWEDDNSHAVAHDEILLDNKYLVNHTKGIYMNCNKYKEKSIVDGWTVHPLPLLTAVGNGQGGGDYYGVNEQDVGKWYMDLVSIEDDVPKGYDEVLYTFSEE